MISQELQLYRPIPLEFPSIGGWKDVPIVENGEPLVPLGPFSPYRDIYTDAIYAGERISSPYRGNPLEGSLLTMFVRKSIAEQLRGVDRSLSNSMHIVVYDAYRTVETQQSLFERYINVLRVKRPDLTEEQRLAWTTKYVSEPSLDPNKPSIHNTGGSVDVVFLYLSRPEAEDRLREIDKRLEQLDTNHWRESYPLEVERTTLMSKYGRQLPLPTRFDYGGDEAALRYLEFERQRRELTIDEENACWAERILHNHMRGAGFESLESEWWHYNSKKTQMGAKTAGLPHAEFGPATLSRENLAHEQMRRSYLQDMQHLREGWRPDIRSPKNEYYELVREVNDRVPPWEYTTVPMVDIIMPFAYEN